MFTPFRAAITVKRPLFSPQTEPLTSLSVCQVLQVSFQMFLYTPWDNLVCCFHGYSFWRVVLATIQPAWLRIFRFSLEQAIFGTRLWFPVNWVLSYVLGLILMLILLFPSQGFFQNIYIGSEDACILQKQIPWYGNENHDLESLTMPSC